MLSKSIKLFFWIFLVFVLELQLVHGDSGKSVNSLAKDIIGKWRSKETVDAEWEATSIELCFSDDGKLVAKLTISENSEKSVDIQYGTYSLEDNMLFSSVWRTDESMKVWFEKGILNIATDDSEHYEFVRVSSIPKLIVLGLIVFLILGGVWQYRWRQGTKVSENN